LFIIPHYLHFNSPTILASGHSKNRCWMYSSLSQIKQVVFLCQLCLIRLPFVRITFLCKNHMKILIFSGTFISQIYLWRYLVCPFK
jgi:hypothetical protein